MPQKAKTRFRRVREIFIRIFLGEMLDYNFYSGTCNLPAGQLTAKDIVALAIVCL